MSSFKGTYFHAVDEKGRINLPSKLRKYVLPDANDTFVITRGFEQCLYVYPLDEWNILEAKLRNLSTYDADDRYFMRSIMPHAFETTLDAQARIAIPQTHREYAGLQTEVQVIGTLDKIEIWNPAIYDEYIKRQTETFESVAAKVMKKP